MPTILLFPAVGAGIIIATILVAIALVYLKDPNDFLDKKTIIITQWVVIGELAISVLALIASLILG